MKVTRGHAHRSGVKSPHPGPLVRALSKQGMLWFNFIISGMYFVAKENIQGWIQEFLIEWGSPNFGSEKAVELFCGKLLLKCFSICEHWSPMVQEILACELR